MEYQGISGTIYQIESECIAGGGEGSIHRIFNNNHQVAKIFKQEKRDPQREKKLLFMVETKLSEEQLKQITWPQDVLYDRNGFAGYIMPKLEKSESLTAIYSTGKYDLRQRLMVAYNLCVAVNTVHSAGHICGDLNPQNICVNLDKNNQKNIFKVTLVDTDSYHIVTPEVTFRCEVGLADYLAPEIQQKVTNGQNLKNAPLPTYTVETDLFALAVHIFNLLMNGCHPFACAKDADMTDSNIEQITADSHKQSVVAPQPIENIRDGFFPFYQARDGITYPVYAPEFNSLPEILQEMFIRTFVNGFDEPSIRVKTDEWMKALETVAKNITKCDMQHYYFDNAKECPFCKVNERIRKVMGGEVFISLKNDFDDKAEHSIGQEESVSSTSLIKKKGIKVGLLILGSIFLGFLGLIVFLSCLSFYSDTGATSETFYSESFEAENTLDWIEKDFPVCGVELSVPGDANCDDYIDSIDVSTSRLSCYSMMMRVGRNEYITQNLNTSNFLLSKKTDEALVESYKDYISDVANLQSCEIIKLGNYWFIKAQFNFTDSVDSTLYYCEYYAFDGDMEYTFSLFDENPIDGEDISIAEQIISSMQIYHVPVNIKLINSAGDDVSLSEEGYWMLYLNKGDTVDDSASGVHIYTYDGCPEIEKLMLPSGHYSVMLVHEDEDNFKVIETCYSSFDVPGDSSGAEVKVTIDK